MSEVLVAEISGKRPGNKSNRPTEKYEIAYDHVIISNNSDGYETDWEIINVPDDYRKWYCANCKTSENAWYAPMNRSYAIQYAKERGYRYLVQLDDNITNLSIQYRKIFQNGVTKHCRINSKRMDDFIEMLICVLRNTNAAMAGCELSGIGIQKRFTLISERYCYSLFALDLATCPEIFQGDFEDDIEYRLKCAEMGLPVVQLIPFQYGKTGQISNKDESGNRAAYTQAGLLRGEHMRRIHGDVYSCGYSRKTASVNGISGKFFRHRVKPFKVGVIVKDKTAIKAKFQEILSRQTADVKDKVVIKERRLQE